MFQTRLNWWLYIVISFIDIWSTIVFFFGVRGKRVGVLPDGKRRPIPTGLANESPDIKVGIFGRGGRGEPPHFSDEARSL